MMIDLVEDIGEFSPTPYSGKRPIIFMLERSSRSISLCSVTFTNMRLPWDSIPPKTVRCVRAKDPIHDSQIVGDYAFQN